MRGWIVVRLIRCANRGWTASYSAYVRCEEEGLPCWWHDFWTWCARRIERVTLGLARKLDKDNRWMGAEMAEHGWWG